MVLPKKCKDQAEFRQALLEDGVAIFDCNQLIQAERKQNPEASQEAVCRKVAANLPWMLLEGNVNCLASLAPTEIKMQADNDGKVKAVTYGDQKSGSRHGKNGVEEGNASGTDHLVVDPLHVDGAKAYGYKHPDYIFLLCQKQCTQFGENFSVDGEELLKNIRESMIEDERWVADALFVRPVRQIYYSVTAVGKTEWDGPLVTRTPKGRVIFQCPNVFEASDRVLCLENSNDPEKDKAMIRIFSTFFRDAQLKAQRFKLQEGEVVCFDNYRMSHGRDPYADLDRTLWRVWAWSESCNGVPDGLVGSDPRRDCDI
mmetsp:Transcript_212/g.426  ORF Transcript_212/g.426 Transcript_212/m.426 type:complete len:314 (-) Transcript_212:26-967(-)|eukprot:CAMPEP_0203788964 /NCGR_PEP_ID=MMETSP0100_2-20121128/3152_1 /ASSEMBLY_ACC=CAM_ASM_000210 /TAXON_ID=96639 /ORGANISM=" , Strain NY0313808BC1" /LENGTH=313 /DNA_ID=CAMNT_0050691791 /DNA_START=365 /DNA_END=1303 /DNA_ORIENTATION=-